MSPAPANRPKPVVLCVLDGWGWREERADNAVALAATPNFDALWSSCPRGFLDACGEDVGLPDGQIGNSEVGHMNLGAGRVVFQDLPRIDRAIADGELERNPALAGLVAMLKDGGGTCHLMGLASPGGVHAHQRHMAALANRVAVAGVPVVVHAFTDGRDVGPTTARGQLADLVAALGPGVRVGTVCGRYFAMDRDKRWERVKTAFDAMVHATGARAADAVAAVDAAYAAGTTDEFVPATVIGDYAGMREGDGILFANFRADRAREILDALLDPGFDGFDRGAVPRIASAVGLVEYSEGLAKRMATILPPKVLTRVFGEVVADAGLTQLRLAETEKYPHVTFFFNGGEERQYRGEERIMVPSPKVATYDLKPEMSAAEVADRLVEAIDADRFDVVVVNFANPDMVGHTGSLPAAIKAVETVDGCLGRLAEAVRRKGGALLVTADHGNCEMMRDPTTGGPHTAHTLNRVPILLAGGPPSVRSLADGRLADVAPTLLALLGVAQPEEMTGRSLLREAAR